MGTLGTSSALSTLGKLKVVSTAFLLVCFLSLKESTCETRKKCYFTLKAFFVFDKIEVQNFRYSNAMTSSNAEA